MDTQTVIVIVIALICVVFLARKYVRAAKGATGGGGCGCGCGGDCPAEKKDRCGGNESS